MLPIILQNPEEEPTISVIVDRFMVDMGAPTHALATKAPISLSLSHQLKHTDPLGNYK